MPKASKVASYAELVPFGPLVFLRSEVFEDLRGIPFSPLTQKVLALLLIATGRRISEIARLSRITHVRVNRAYIEWIPGFRAR